MSGSACPRRTVRISEEQDRLLPRVAADRLELFWFENTQFSPWPGLNRPTSRRASARREKLFSAKSVAVQTHRRWMAGSEAGHGELGFGCCIYSTQNGFGLLLVGAERFELSTPSPETRRRTSISLSQSPFWKRRNSKHPSAHGFLIPKNINVLQCWYEQRPHHPPYRRN